MFRNHGKVILGLLIALPTLLCFVGVGALLHLAAQATAFEHQEQLEKAQQASDEQEPLEKKTKDLERLIEQIRKKLAEREKAQRCQEELARLEAEKTKLQALLDWLRNKLDGLERKLAGKGAESDELRRRVQEARKKVEQLQRKIAQMAPSDKPGGSPPDNGPSIAELQRKIAQAEAALKEKEKRVEQAEAEWDRLRQVGEDDSAISVEEIHGTEDWQMPPNPLYVECDAAGIVLQTENVRLPANPDKQQRERFVRVARQRGYVLFLIRPNGVDSFRRYRALIINEKIDFGYEPIKQQGPVRYPERS